MLASGYCSGWIVQICIICSWLFFLASFATLVVDTTDENSYGVKEMKSVEEKEWMICVYVKYAHI